MKIVVLDGSTVNPGDNPWTPLESLGELHIYERSTPDEVVDRATDADIVVINKIRLGESEFQQLPHLKLVAVTATGHDCVDSGAARAHGVSVCNVPEYGTESVAQFTMALLLELCHRVGRHDQLIREGEWQRAGDFSFFRSPQRELVGQTMAIVGWGRIGQRVGRIAQAFGLEIIAVSRSQTAELPDGVRWGSLAEAFSTADTVSLHCPLTDKTAGMVNATVLRTMRRSALLINTARGGLVKDDDLATALNEGCIAGAALDVVTQEPIHPENPLLGAANCLLTPHMAWSSLAARSRLMRMTATNIRGFLDGVAQNVVN
ncbi:MAG: D-2-hydroxyacid dehydrogenase [Planctomycetales bacterium]|nr:D-2-hydroxyacid dehydrogenase [Planctomycetales bacterium]